MSVLGFLDANTRFFSRVTAPICERHISVSTHPKFGGFVVSDTGTSSACRSLQSSKAFTSIKLHHRDRKDGPTYRHMKQSDILINRHVIWIYHAQPISMATNDEQPKLRKSPL